jgi:hypothetical protein
MASWAARAVPAVYFATLRSGSTTEKKRAQTALFPNSANRLSLQADALPPLQRKLPVQVAGMDHACGYEAVPAIHY